jgi:hypothetical protein
MARCGLWREALADYREALIDVMLGVPLDATEQGLCRRAVDRYLRRDLAIEGLLDDHRMSHEFAAVLRQSGNREACSLFASALSRYAREKLAHGKKLARAGRALALARQIAGLRSWLP